MWKYLACLVTGLLLGAGLMCGVQIAAQLSSPPRPTLRPATAMRITPHPWEGIAVKGCKPIDIPPEKLDFTFRLLTPGKWYGNTIYDQVTRIIAEAEITHADGTQTFVIVRDAGHNPAVVSLDGRTYFFGRSDPDILAGGTQLMQLLADVAHAQAKTAAQQPASPGGSPFGGQLIDLSHPYDASTIYWPTEQGFRFEKGNNGVTTKGYYYAANRFTTAEHGGTHLDAPIHFAADHETADQIDLRRLLGEAVVVDVSQECRANPDYLVSVADLRTWEEKHGRQLVDVILLIRTGWSQHWPDRLKYLGTEALGPAAIAQLHFPGLAPEAAKWLVEQRQIKAIGIDTASIDYGQSSLFEAHVALCGHSVPIFENIMNLERIPAEKSHVVALPMKIAGGSGGPLRIVAILPK
jgi:kynurenine formamidase